MKYVYSNNKILSLVIHAGHDGGDVEEKIHNYSGWYKLAAQIQNIAFINHLELIAADFNWRSKNLKKCRRGSLVYTLQPFV